MPRGRHRNSLQLRRLLPPLTAATLASACAGSAWLSDDPTVIRVIVAAAAAAVFTGAVLQRRRDRAYEKEIARLQSARIRDEWRTDEKIAELESDLDEYREIRSRVERQLAAKRTELARLRGEHAALLKRYAVAESERAAGLETVRLALAPGPADQQLAPSAYLRANAALDSLSHNAARQREDREAEAAGRFAAEESGDDTRAERESWPVGGSGGEPVGREGVAGIGAFAAEQPSAEGIADEQHGRATMGADGLQAVRDHDPGAAAVAVLPLSAAQQPARSVPEPGFDFFGTQRALPPSRVPTAALTSGASPHRVQAQGAAEGTHGDLADVVGDELAPRAGHADSTHGTDTAGTADADGADRADGTGSEDRADRAEGEDGDDGEGGTDAEGADGEDGAVIDLTEHDETELIDVRRLRALS